MTNPNEHLFLMKLIQQRGYQLCVSFSYRLGLGAYQHSLSHRPNFIPLSDYIKYKSFIN
jgi:hypothetical protein